GIATEAERGEVYGVLAKKVVADKHVGETPPWERARCLWWVGLGWSHRASRLCFSCRARHVPTCRNERKRVRRGGKAQGRGFTHPEQRGGRAQRRSAQAKRGRLGSP